MYDYKYLTSIPITNSNKIMNKYIGDKVVQKRLEDKSHEGDVRVENLKNGLQLLYCTLADWHYDYKVISTLLILQSDRHIIQIEDECVDNYRILKKGDIVRLNIDCVHRLISNKQNPKLFVALVMEPKKMKTLEASVFFTYVLKQLDV